MEVYLICGLACSGKTTVGNKLISRGYEVIDTDETFAYWANLATEEPLEVPDLESLTEEWFEINGWIWNRKKVIHALKNNKKTLFFCGSSDKASEYFNQFNKIFRLYTDSETLKKRLMARNYFLHNSPLYITRELRFLQNEEIYAQTNNMVLINTAQHSVDETVGIILKSINSYKGSNFKLNQFQFHRLVNLVVYKMKILKKRIIETTYYNFIRHVKK